LLPSINTDVLGPAMVHFEPWKHMGLVLGNGIPCFWPCSLFACEFEEWQAIKLIDSRVGVV